MRRDELIHRLAGRILNERTDHPLRVGVDGVDTAGKTTLADELASALRELAPNREVIRASIDRFHLPRAIRYRQGPDTPEGYYADSFDLAALRLCLLDPLSPGGSCQVILEHFDFRADQPVNSPPIAVTPDAVLIFDGVFLLRPELRDCWDLSIFVQVSFDTVLARATARDAAWMGGEDAAVARYRQRYIPAQAAYLAACRPAEFADLVIRNDDPHNPEFIIHSTGDQPL